MTTSPSENETLNLNVEDHSTVHRYTLDDEEICAIFSRPIYRKIIASPAFQRLKKIRFLGAIDYVLNPDKPSNMHCRYQHSLGVAKLALQYAKSLDFSDDLETLCVVAALLHDIGHAPLSHSLEPMFQELHDMNHHKAGETILLGDVRVGSKLWKTLTEAESGAFRLFSVMALIEGHGSYCQVWCMSID